MNRAQLRSQEKGIKRRLPVDADWQPGRDGSRAVDLSDTSDLDSIGASYKITAGLSGGEPASSPKPSKTLPSVIKRDNIEHPKPWPRPEKGTGFQNREPLN